MNLNELSKDKKFFTRKKLILSVLIIFCCVHLVFHSTGF